MNQEKLNRIAELSDQFVEDVLPQAAKLSFQDYGALNDLCVLLTEWKNEKAANPS